MTRPLNPTSWRRSFNFRPARTPSTRAVSNRGSKSVEGVHSAKYRSLSKLLRLQMAHDVEPGREVAMAPRRGQAQTALYKSTEVPHTNTSTPSLITLVLHHRDLFIVNCLLVPLLYSLLCIHVHTISLIARTVKQHLQALCICASVLKSKD